MTMNSVSYMNESPLFGGVLLEDSCSLYWDSGNDLQALLFPEDVHKIPQEQTSDNTLILSSDALCLGSMLGDDFLSLIQPVGSPESEKSFSSEEPSTPDSGWWSSSAASPADVMEDKDNIANELEQLLYRHELSTALPVPISASPINNTIEVPLNQNIVTTADQPSTNLNVLVIDQSGQQSFQPLTVSQEPLPTKTGQNGEGSKGKLKTMTVKDKRQRKRNQNKNAATRYREKKRGEESKLKGELSDLSEHNHKLKDKEFQFTREISYLKELLIEVYKTKGLIE